MKTCPVTSLKLPNQLKEGIQSLVSGTGRTAHAFMVEAIERAAQAEELRRRFGEGAAAALYRWAPADDAALILAIRHSKQTGYFEA